MKFDCKNAPKSEIVSDLDRIDGVALSGDTILLSTIDAVYSMPNDRSTEPKMIGKIYDGSMLAVLGDRVYYQDFFDLASVHFDGTGTTKIESAIHLQYVVTISSDGSSIYAAEMNCNPMEPIAIVSAMGKAEDIFVDCPKGMTFRNGTGYILTGDDDTHTLQKLGPNHKLEVIAEDVKAAAHSDYMTASDTYLYYWADKYLTRMPLKGGEPEKLAGPTGLNAHLFATKDNVVVVEVIDGGGSGICIVTFDESTKQLKPVADASNVWQVAADDKWFYFATNSLRRVPR